MIWSAIISEIELAAHIPWKAFTNIDAFSHLEILYFFEQVNEQAIVFSGHPRGDTSYPVIGIFGQRKKDRPNRMGLCTFEQCYRKDNTLSVKNLDAIDGTPVIDINLSLKSFNRLEISGNLPGWAT